MDRDDPVNAQHHGKAPRGARRAVWLGGGCVLASALLTGWLWFQTNTNVHVRAVSDAQQRAALTVVTNNERRNSAPEHEVSHQPVRTALTPVNATSVAVPDATDDAPNQRPHPHPIDEERRRIYRENNLSVALMGAMNGGDYHGLRALIEEYRASYPEDEHRLQEGYSLIADCMERLTAERQNEARDYWRTNRGSIVRRFIRRHCLDKPIEDG